MYKNQISVVLGSKNRKNLLKATIDSIRHNGFSGKMEIIVIDGGSVDGTCNWLAKQRDILTIIQPNYKIIDQEGISILAHSWGEFMNIGFRYASGKYILMVSDDLILERGCIQKGYDEIERRLASGEKIGSGAFFFREFPRHDYYRVGVLPGGYIALNHGFYLKQALEEVGYLDEKSYNFYYADSDVIMRLNKSGWKSIFLDDCYANHLCHKPTFNKRLNYPPSHIRDKNKFDTKYPADEHNTVMIKKYSGMGINAVPFYKYGFTNVIYGYLLKLYDYYQTLGRNR
jgi:glycosyltransferase involved in cell wall biosynthesis